VAIGIIIAARRLGITVPAELSVIGIDGHSYAEMFALTTFEQEPRAQGRRAVEILLQDLEEGRRPQGPDDEVGGDAVTEVQWPTRLMIRQTTTRPEGAE
jgi:DNA-binding LacI/PurR family transcriptional regulator